MNIRDLMVKTSILAFVAAGIGAAEPALAQTKATAKDQAKDDDAKEKAEDRNIIVTARRKALQTAIENKRNADTIIESVVADEAGQLPDNSITEVLQRVSGVALSRFVAVNGGSTSFQIEGTGFSVRGLPYSTSTVNGRQVFSANSGSAISWGEVTPELMSGVDLYKASRADLIEGGVSSVDLRTRLPFDFSKTEFNVSVGASYGDQSKKSSPRASALFSKRFDTGIGEFGVLWDFAFSRLYQQSSNLQVGAMFGEYAPSAPTNNNIALVPSGFNWSVNKNKRDRYGAYQAVQWAPNSDLTFTNTLFFSQYVSDSLSQSGGFGRTPSQIDEIMPQLGSDPVYDSAGAFKRGTLILGSTGNASFGNNTTAEELMPADWASWFPREALNISCGGNYGDPVSSLKWDWGNYPNIISCNTPQSSLNPNSGSSSGHSKSSTLDLSQSFIWTPGDRLRVRGGVQYVYSRATGRNMFVSIAEDPSIESHPPLVTSVDVDLTGTLPKISGLNQDGLLDPANHYLGSMGYNGPDNTGRMLAGNLDLDYRLSDNGFLRTISIGGRAARRTEKDNFIGTYWAPLGASWLNNIQYLDTINPSDFETTKFPNFFGGRLASPGNMLMPAQSLMKSRDWYYMLSTYNGTIEDGTREQYWNMIDGGMGRTSSRISTIAGYVQAKFAHDGLGFVPAFSGNIGVRVFRESVSASGNLSEPAVTEPFVLTEADSALVAALRAPGGEDAGVYPTMYTMVQSVTPQTRKYSYTRILPSFNIKFDVSRNFVVRAAASISSSPPNLNDVRAGGSITPRLLNSGNPLAPGVLTGVKADGGGANLKPVTIRSQDLSFEYYPNSQSLFYFNVFAKQIEDQALFYSFTADNLPIPVVALVNGETTGGTPTTLSVPWLYLQNKTSDVTAHMKGFEVGGRTFFSQLPGFLKGFGIEANLTYIDSKSPAQQANHVLSPPTANGGLNADGTVPQTYPNLPYPGLAKWAYNVQLLYSIGKVNVRLAYNWRDKALLSTNVNPLSFATSGGNPYTLNTSPTNFDPVHSYPVYNMVPAWIASAGYLDLGFDYKVNDRISISAHANNLLDTVSRTLQEPIPGVFQPYDTNVSDRRFDISARIRF